MINNIYAVRKTSVLTTSLALVLMMLLGVLAVGTPAGAQTDPGGAPSTTQNIDPTFHSGNVSCTGLGYDYGYKIDSAPFYRTNVGDGALIVSTTGSGGQYFDWTSNIGVDAVIVKGGPNSDAFVYEPGKGEVTVDTRLHAPENPNGSGPFGISHIEFCYDLELKVSKTANTSFTRTHNWTIEKSVSPESLDLFRGDSGEAEYTVKATKTGFTDSDHAVNGTITVSNPNTMPVLVTSVTDQISGSPSTTAQVTCKDASGTTVPLSPSTPYPLAPANPGNTDTLVCSYSASLSNNSDRTNTATASGFVPGKIFRDGVGTAAVKFGDPTKVVNDSINVGDDFATPDDATDDKSFAFNASGSEKYTREFSCDDDAGTYKNTATIKETGQSDDASVTVNCHELTVTKDANTSFTRTHNWTIEKSVSPESLDLFRGDSGEAEYTVKATKTGFTDSDHAVNGTITVSNDTPIDANLASVTDVVSGDSAIEASVECRDANGDAVSFPSYTLKAGETLECDYGSGLPDASDRTNTATATLQNNTGTTTTDFSGEAAVSFTNATITPVNDSINVDDDLGTPDNATDDKSFAFGASGSETYKRTFSCDADDGTHLNTATIRETEQSDGASVEVRCHELEVSKTADTSFTRTFDWTIEKSADPSVLNLFQGDDGKVNYSLKVGATSEDSNHAVNGKITIVNTAPIDASLAGVSDVVSGDSPIEANVECADANGPVSFPYTLASGGTLECDYSAGLGDKLDRTNTATATLQNNTGGTTGFSGEAAVSFANATINQINDKVNVDDDFGTSADATDDKSFAFNANDALETFNRRYERTFSCDADAGDHLNTATIRETGRSDDATVRVNCYDLTVEKTAIPSFTRTHNWDIEKKVNGKDDDTLDLFKGDSGDAAYTVDVTKTDTDNDFAVSGRITITNPAPIDANLASVTDAFGGKNAQVDCPNPNDLVVQANNGQLVCDYVIRFESRPADGTNTATATLRNNGGTTTDFSGTAEVRYGEPTTVINRSVTVDDSVQGNLGTFSGSGSAQPYEQSFSCNSDGGLHENTASVIGDGGTVLASDTASVTVNCYNLNVTKDATASFDRAYKWTIDKTADQSNLTLAINQSLPVNYTVTVGLDATAPYTDSNHLVSGKIIIYNPAPIPANLASVTDNVAGVNAGVTCPDGYIVPAASDAQTPGTLVCTYELKDKVEGTNTATAELQNYDYDSRGNPTPAAVNTTFSGTAEVRFGDVPTNEIDNSITVTDDSGTPDPGDDRSLGSATVGVDTLPKVFQYTRNVGPYPASGQYQDRNVASFVTNTTGTTGSDDHTVVITVPQQLEACTPGFWQGGSGTQLWNTKSDPDWKGYLAQPYHHNFEFNKFFTPHSRLNGQTMFQVISNGATEVAANKAARSLVAAYLNTSYKAGYPYSQAQLKNMWTQAVSGGNSRLSALHDKLDAANNNFDCRG